MSYLLDTHALVWALTAEDRLGSAARKVLADRQSSLAVSAATAWELATKFRLGKLPAAEVLISGFARHLRDLGARELDVTAEHALLAGTLGWPHRDPFDRMLAAQCMTESLTLVTRDRVFDALASVRTLW